MTKNILLTVSILTAFLIVPTLVFGQSVSPSPNVSPVVSPSPSPGVSPGLTPDNPLYFLKNWKEKIQLFFTFGAENKAKQYLHLSEVRLAEYQKMLEKGKTKIAEKTREKYEKQLDRALQKVEEVKNKGKDVQDILEKVEQSQERRLEVLQQNLQKVPEQVRQGIQNAIDNSKIKIERFKERLGVTPVPTPTVSPVPSPTATPDQTVGWKKYKNKSDEFGYEFKYPSNWFLQGDKGPNYSKTNLRVKEQYIFQLTTDCEDPGLGGYCQKDIKSLGEAIEREKIEEIKMPMWWGETIVGFITFNGGKGVLFKQCDWQGEINPHPHYLLSIVKGDKWITINVYDSTRTFAKKEFCDAYLQKISTPQKMNSRDYKIYDDFIDLIYLTLKVK